VKAAQLCIPIVFLLQSLLPLPFELSIECRHTNRHSHNCCKRNWQYPARHFVAPFPGSCVVNGKDRVRCMMISPAQHLSAFFPPQRAKRARVDAPRQCTQPPLQPSPCPLRTAKRHADAAKCPNGDRKDSSRTQMTTRRIRRRASRCGKMQTCDASSASMTTLRPSKDAQEKLSMFLKTKMLP
jgi:hypothetical protein